MNQDYRGLNLLTKLSKMGWPTSSQQAFIKAPNAESSDGFGTSVSVSGDDFLVSAWRESSNQTTITNGTTASADNSASNAGAAYIFTK